MHSKKLNHIAAGVLASFVGRNNDVGGYWALGVLYREAASNGNTVALDLLAPDTAAPSPAAASAARHYAQFLHGALQRQGLAADTLAQARIAVAFNTTAPAHVHYTSVGDIFACSITLAGTHGSIAERTVYGRCQPCTEGRFTRSTRVPAPAK